MNDAWDVVPENYDIVWPDAAAPGTSTCLCSRVRCQQLISCEPVRVPIKSLDLLALFGPEAEFRYHPGCAEKRKRPKTGE